jgi:hypothetical protein
VIDERTDEAKARAGVIAALGPEVAEEVLAHVTFTGDVDAYARDVIAVAMPVLEAKVIATKAEVDAMRAKADALEAQYAEWLAQFERFRNLSTSSTVH